MDAASLAFALPLAHKLRTGGIKVEIEHRASALKSVGNQLKRANKLKARLAVIVGGNEIASGKLAVKDLATGTQHEVPVAELEAKVAELGVKQTAARRMDALLADLGAIRTMRATHNVGADSGSAIAAEKGYENDYLQSLRADILSQRYGIVSRLTEASGLRAGARAATIGGYGDAFSSIARGFAQFGGGKPK